jgi:hypothetical protein
MCLRKRKKTVIVNENPRSNMETTDKGILTIKTDNDNNKSVVFNPANGTVWLSKCELIELFDVYRQTVDACIQGICKPNIFNMETVCKCNYIVKAGKIEYDPYEFNLEFIIAMAFRINSVNAQILREWIISKVLRHKTVFFQIPAIIQDYQWN